MVLAEDQHAVGEFDSDGSDESFGVAVGLGTPGRDLDDSDAGIGEHRVEGCGQLSGSVANQEPEFGCAVTELGDEVACVLCGPGSVGVGGGTDDVDVAGVALDHEEHCECWTWPGRASSSGWCW